MFKLAWHPDKNKGREDVATRVFQFVQARPLRFRRRWFMVVAISDSVFLTSSSTM